MAGIVLAVTGAVGGCGASLLAASLAVHAAHVLRGLGRAQVGLVDANIWGAGLDVLLGMEEAPGVRWPQLANAHGEVDWSHLVTVLPAWLGVPLVSVDRTNPVEVPSAAFAGIAAGAARGGHVLIVDAPPAIVRHLGEVVTHHVVVVPRTVRGVAGAVSVLAAMGWTRHSGRGWQWGGPGPSPVVSLVAVTASGQSLTPGQVASHVGVSLAGEWPWVSQIGHAVEHGALASGLPSRLVKAGARISVVGGLDEALHRLNTTRPGGDQ